MERKTGGGSDRIRIPFNQEGLRMNKPDPIIDRLKEELAGEVEHRTRIQSSLLERIEKLKKSSTQSAAPKGQVTKLDIKDTLKNSALVAVGSLTAAVSSGNLNKESIIATIAVALGTFLKRLLSNGDESK